MKLLGWMHRKFRQNSNEPFKDFSIGNSCACITGQPSLDDSHCNPKQNYCTKPLLRGQRDNQLRKSFACPDTARIDEYDLEEETSSAAISELFHGFLAIGTLGMDPVITDPVITDPSTPTFSISVENIMEKETEVTENELKLINDELEKVLGADETCNLSSGRNSYVSTGRNSHVSTGRSSHCSTITLGGKPIESCRESNASGTMVCPLQGYLLGSAIGLPETTPATKKEHRMSLGELFQKTKQTEENYGAKPDRVEKKPEKETDKSAAFIVKKMLKKKILHASHRNSMTDSGGTTDSTSAETKLHKILHIFHRKVHPESLTAAQKSNKPTQMEVRSDVTYKRSYIIGGSESTDEDITITPCEALSKERLRRFKSQSNPPQLSLKGDNSFGTGEHWIKTDSDYLVLEL